MGVRIVSSFPPPPPHTIPHSLTHIFIPRPSGVRFVALPGTSEFLRRCQPKEGDIVSFKHHGFLLGSGKPKLPTLYRLRTDVTWQDVVDNWKGIKPLTRSVIGGSLNSQVLPIMLIIFQILSKTDGAIRCEASEGILARQGTPKEIFLRSG